ncbi:MAG: hypothetical protein KC449_17735, partial [Anaerolineales bacterium]|nr:hypothetical protein [Anaerolineales bacterium]
KAAVYENDASLNGYFVGVASHFGNYEVAKALFDYAQRGTEVERAHALGCFYWVLVGLKPEEENSLLELLKDIALNSTYSDSIRDYARRYYEATTQQSMEESL